MHGTSQITGSLAGIDGAWFRKLAKDGLPLAEFREAIDHIPVAELPGIVPMWSIALPINGGFSVSMICRRPATQRRSGHDQR